MMRYQQIVADIIHCKVKNSVYYRTKMQFTDAENDIYAQRTIVTGWLFILGREYYTWS